MYKQRRTIETVKVLFSDESKLLNFCFIFPQFNVPLQPYLKIKSKFYAFTRFFISLITPKLTCINLMRKSRFCIVKKTSMYWWKINYSFWHVVSNFFWKWTLKIINTQWSFIIIIVVKMNIEFSMIIFESKNNVTLCSHLTNPD